MSQPPTAGRLDARALAAELDGGIAALAALDEPAARAAALALAIRAAELHVIDRVRPALAEYPATIQEHFATAESPAISVQDAFADPGMALGFLDVLELCSDQALSCIAPRLYRGWQDRNQARRDARRLTTAAVGFALGAEERDALLAALAIRQRLLAISPPVELDGEQVDEALAAVRALLHRLAPGE